MESKFRKIGGIAIINNEEYDILEVFEQYKKIHQLCERCEISLRDSDGRLKSLNELFTELNEYYLKNCQTDNDKT